jgi:hypothetical protein
MTPLICREKLAPKETEMNTVTASTTESPAGQRNKTSEQLEALAIRANGLADRASQSLKQVLEAQTGHRISNATASTIRLIVQNIIDAAVASARYKDATS